MNNFDSPHFSPEHIHQFGSIVFNHDSFHGLPTRGSWQPSKLELVVGGKVVLDLLHPEIEGERLFSEKTKIMIDGNSGTHFDTISRSLVLNYFELKNPSESYPFILCEELAHAHYINAIKTALNVVSEGINFPSLFAELPPMIQELLRSNMNGVTFFPDKNSTYDFDNDISLDKEVKLRKKYRIASLYSVVNEFFAKRQAYRMVSEWVADDMGRSGLTEDQVKEILGLSLVARATENVSIHAWGFEEAKKIWLSGFQFLFPEETRTLSLPQVSDPQQLRKEIDKRYDFLNHPVFNKQSSETDTFLE